MYHTLLFCTFDQIELGDWMTLSVKIYLVNFRLSITSLEWFWAKLTSKYLIISLILKIIPFNQISKEGNNLFMKVAFILSQPDKQFQRMDFPLEVSSTNAQPMFNQYPNNIQPLFNPSLLLIIPKLRHKWKRSNGHKLRCQNSIRSSQGASNPEACVTISAKLHHFWICDLDQF